jgi:hypothetical protein
MRRPTLVFLKAHYVDGSLAHCVGDEFAPGLFTQETIDRALDSGHLAECAERRSLYRLLPRFSGCKEQEQLTPKEKQDLCL